MPRFEISTYNAQSLIHYQGVLTRFFEQHNLIRKDRHLDQESLSAFIKLERENTRALLRPGFDKTDRELDERARYFAWLRDSMLWTIEELLAGFRNKNAERPYVYALRGLLQVCEYAGHVGHDSTTHDCSILLRNIIEGACEFASRGE